MDEEKLYIFTTPSYFNIPPKVDVAVFRDLDSVATERESAAVNEWLASKHAFHTMRDHPDHGAMPMMAGMWGAKVSYLQQNIDYIGP